MCLKIKKMKLNLLVLVAMVASLSFSCENEESKSFNNVKMTIEKLPSCIQSVVTEGKPYAKLCKHMKTNPDYLPASEADEWEKTKDSFIIEIESIIKKEINSHTNEVPVCSGNFNK